MADGSEENDIGVITENLELQVSEVAMLQSMFPNEKEFKLEDEAAFIDVQDFLVGKLEGPLPPRLEFCVSVEVCNEKDSCFNIYVSLPHSYPKSSPEIYIRSEKLTRNAQKDLNHDLFKAMVTLEEGELWILPVIQWLKEHAGSYLKESCLKATDHNKHVDQETKGSFMRLWMYMHHIYNKTKRKVILEWSSDYSLTGFCLPGKPGVVCIEGEEGNVEEYYGRLRRLNWKKITCRHRETYNKLLDIDGQRKFIGFHELSFEVQGTRENHMDMGQFYQYLEEHGFGYMFQILFGIEGK
ncbi:RWD domain-containing protein 2B [Nematostella vectensis]|uniref:RWD domain-containing protein 2B n=1 Tax=Nematostella vectensis TaxID=45351 RepID=UPI0020770E4E|nr:RWD domain-containing protein 2B [Nematostella vectensis]